MTNITSYTRNFIDYLKCKPCVYETCIVKTIDDDIYGFKTRMNNQIIIQIIHSYLKLL